MLINEFEKKKYNKIYQSVILIKRNKYIAREWKEIALRAGAWRGFDCARVIRMKLKVEGRQGSSDASAYFLRFFFFRFLIARGGEARTLP